MYIRNNKMSVVSHIGLEVIVMVISWSYLFLRLTGRHGSYLNSYYYTKRFLYFALTFYPNANRIQINATQMQHN